MGPDACHRLKEACSQVIGLLDIHFDNALNMEMSPTLLALLQGIVVLSLLRVLWLVLRPFVTRSPLANVRGPRAESLFTGMCPIVSSSRKLSVGALGIGNLGRMVTRHSWDYQDKVSEEYGAVVRLNGMLCVRVHNHPASNLVWY